MRSNRLPTTSELATLWAHDDDAARAFAATEPELRENACAIVREKAQTVIEVWPLIAFLFSDPEPDEKAWRKVMKPGVAEPLRAAAAVLAETDPFEPAVIERDLRALIEQQGIGVGKALQPTRVAITGCTISPGLFESLAVWPCARSSESPRRWRGSSERSSETAFGGSGLRPEAISADQGSERGHRPIGSLLRHSDGSRNQDQQAPAQVGREPEPRARRRPCERQGRPAARRPG